MNLWGPKGPWGGINPWGPKGPWGGINPWGPKGPCDGINPWGLWGGINPGSLPNLFGSFGVPNPSFLGLPPVLGALPPLRFSSCFPYFPIWVLVVVTFTTYSPSWVVSVLVWLSPTSVFIHLLSVLGWYFGWYFGSFFGSFFGWVFGWVFGSFFDWVFGWYLGW